MCLSFVAAWLVPCVSSYCCVFAFCGCMIGSLWLLLLLCVCPLWLHDWILMAPVTALCLPFVAVWLVPYGSCYCSVSVLCALCLSFVAAWLVPYGSCYCSVSVVCGCMIGSLWLLLLLCVCPLWLHDWFLMVPVTGLCLPFVAAWLVPYGSCYCSVSVLCLCMIGSLWLLLLLCVCPLWLHDWFLMAPVTALYLSFVAAWMDPYGSCYCSVCPLWLHDWFLMAPVTALCLSFVAAWLVPHGSCYCSVSVLCGCMIGSLWFLLLLCVCPLWLHDWFLMAPVTALCLPFVAAWLVPYGSCYCSVSALCGCMIGSLWFLLLLCVCPLWLHDWFLMVPVTALCLSFVAAWLVPYGSLSCYCSVSVLCGCMIGSLWLLLLLCVCPLWLHDWFLMAPVTALCLSFVAACYWLVPYGSLWLLLLLCVCPLWLHDWFLMVPVTALCLSFVAAWLVPYGSCYCSVSVLCGCMIGSLWLLLLLCVCPLWLHDWFLMAPVTALCLSFVAAWLVPYGSCYCSVSVLCGCMIGSLWLLLLLCVCPLWLHDWFLMAPVTALCLSFVAAWLVPSGSLWFLLLLCVCPLWLHDWFLMAPVTALCLSFVAAWLVPYGSCYCSVSVLCGCMLGSLWFLLLLCVCPLRLHDWFLMAPVTALCLSFVAACLVPYGSCYCSVSVLCGCMIGSLWLLLLLCVCPLWLHDWFLMAHVTALCLSFVAAWLVPYGSCYCSVSVLCGCMIGSLWFLLLLCVCPLWLHDWFLMVPVTAMCLSFVAAWLVPYGSCYCSVSVLCGCMIGSLWLLLLLCVCPLWLHAWFLMVPVLLLLCVCPLWLHDWFLMAPVTALCLSFVAACLVPYGSCYCSVSVLCGCMIGSLWLLLLLCVCPLWLHAWFLMAPVTALCLSFVAAWLVPYGSCPLWLQIGSLWLLLLLCYCYVSVLCGCMIGSLWFLLLLCLPLAAAWLVPYGSCNCYVSVLCGSVSVLVAAWLVPYGSCYCTVSDLCSNWFHDWQ